MEDRGRNTLILIATMIVLFVLVNYGADMVASLKTITFKQFMKNCWVVISAWIIYKGIYCKGELLQYQSLRTDDDFDVPRHAFTHLTAQMTAPFTLSPFATRFMN